jgi:putative sigma-54 modulation protein
MEIKASGKNMELPERLQQYAITKFSRAGRVLDDLKACTAVFTEIKNPSVASSYIVEVTAKTGHGRLIRAETQAPDPYAAVDRAADKLDSQARRLKGRLLARTKNKKGARSRSERSLTEREPLPEAENGIRIARLKKFDLKPLMPEEAAEELELLGHSFYFFTNKESGLPAVVYRRRGGDFGLIEPAVE